MAETTSRGIQATLFDYFQDTEYFKIQEANELVLDYQNRDVNAESIRARIMRVLTKASLTVSAKACIPLPGKTSRGERTLVYLSMATAGTCLCSRITASIVCSRLSTLRQLGVL